MTPTGEGVPTNTLERAMCEFLRHPVARRLRLAHPDATAEAKTAMANVLDAVLPAYRARVRAQALREAASIARDYDAAEVDLLCRARADALTEGEKE